jgi:hypothetical protein
MTVYNERQMHKGNYNEDLAIPIVEFLNQRKYPVGIIYGNPETGKTDTGCLIAEIGLNEGILDTFASNIKTETGQKITSLEEVKYWHRNETGKKLYILDEAGINDDCRNPMSRLNREIRHEIFIARKFFVHWIFILQELKDVDTWKSSNLTGMLIEKDAANKIFYADIKLKWEETSPFYDFPRTTINYDTLDIGVFTLKKQVNEEALKLQGEPAQVARLLKQTHNSDTAALEMSKLTGETWTRKDVMTELYKFLDHLDF